MLRGRWACLAFVALGGPMACSGGHGSSATSTATTAVPRITVTSNGPLGAGLISVADLLSAGMPADITTTAMANVTAFADADPRGACGAKVPPIDPSGGAGVAVKSANVQGAELIVRMDDATATAALAARIADAQAGCADYDTATNTGATQHVHLERVIPILANADQAVATQQANVVDNRVTNATVIRMRKGGLVASITLFADPPPPAKVVQALALLAAEDLARIA